MALCSQQMCLLLREALSVGKIAMAHEFFSNELKHVEAKLRIKDELSSYCVVTEAPKTTFGKVLTCAPMVTMQPTSPHLCSQPQPGAPDVHGQALRQTGRPVHCDPAEPDRLPEGLRCAETSNA
tara:strand:- start:1468 stop:1839 length:372 start_codon:yes stop_codon:yes gene_type:complete